MLNRVAGVFLASALFAVSSYGEPQEKAAPQKNLNKTAVRPSPSPAKAPSSTAPASGAVVFVDPVTRQIRQPEASEIGTLVRRPASSAPAPPLTVVHGPGGAVGVRLPEDTMVYTTATRTADGRVTTECQTGDPAAQAKSKQK